MLRIALRVRLRQRFASLLTASAQDDTTISSPLLNKLKSWSGWGGGTQTLAGANLWDEVQTFPIYYKTLLGKVLGGVIGEPFLKRVLSKKLLSKKKSTRDKQSSLSQVLFPTLCRHLFNKFKLEVVNAYGMAVHTTLFLEGFDDTSVDEGLLEEVK